MDQQETNRVRIWLKIVPLLIIVALFAWCSANNRKSQQLGPVRAELANLFMEHGLVDGNDRNSLESVAKAAGETILNGMFYDAASGASLDALKWLVAQGADPKNVGTQKDMTLLQASALHPRLDRLEYLLGFGLDPLERSRDGRNMLHYAAQGGLDPAVLKLLIAKGLKVSDTDNAGRLPMHYASLKSIGVLVGAGAEIDATDDAGMTPLHQAAREGRNDAVSELLRNAASVFAKDKKGRTPLHYAAMSQKSEAVIDTLRAAGAPVTARDEEGLTPKELGLDSRENSRYRSALDKL